MTLSRLFIDISNWINQRTSFNNMGQTMKDLMYFNDCVIIWFYYLTISTRGTGSLQFYSVLSCLFEKSFRSLFALFSLLLVTRNSL